MDNISIYVILNLLPIRILHNSDIAELISGAASSASDIVLG
jgi:hypothetical protein